MSKSVAFIGLSGPLCYDYKHRLNRQYPNPILEAPLGLMIFYDEIVFLHESVCPRSLRKLNFVKFLSDSKDIKDYFETIEQRPDFDELAKQIWQGSEFPFKQLGQIAKKIAPFSTFDNHSRQLSKEFKITPSSARAINVVYDNIVAHDEKLTLITNSLIDGTLTKRMNHAFKGNLVNNLISQNLPNYLTPRGPFVDTIYDIRDRPFLKEFRDKIYDTVFSAERESLDELTEELQVEFNNILYQFLIDRIKPHTFYNSLASVAKAVVPEIGKSISGVGTGIAALDATRAILDLYEDKEYRWARFLADLKAKTPITKPPLKDVNRNRKK
jgi:hypothetical protein